MLKKKFPIPNPANPDVLEQIIKATPARVAIGRAGTRYTTEAYLKLREDTAVAKDAIWAELPEEFAEKIGGFMVQTMAKSKEDYIRYPDLGKRFPPESIEIIKAKCKKNPRVQICVTDGLSATAVIINVPILLPKLTNYLKEKGIELVNPPIVIKYGRVAISNAVGDILEPELVVLFIGERPGFGIAESLGCYLTYQARSGKTDADRDAFCNIWRLGTPPEEAAKIIANSIEEILFVKKYTGVKV